MAPLTAEQRKELRRLAELAYERELSAELGVLESHFGKWRQGEIDPFELSDAIHQFHQGPARDLYVANAGPKPEALVARALAREVLAEDEVPQAIREALQSMIAYYADTD